MIRRRLLTLSVLLFPAVTFAMSFEDARHLLNRTGFGATPQAIEKFTALEWDDAVNLILSEVQQEPTTTPPYWRNEPVGGLFTLRLLALGRGGGESARLERESIQRKQEQQTRRRGEELRTWWWNEMIRTKSPLTERMTLFWHNHFTSEIGTVGSPELMLQQNQLFRSHALGNFTDLLMAATKDAAMIIYLDNNSNTKGNPNENYARELMELFTLGEGHVYTEEDIRESARAFTGWRVNDVSKLFVFEEKLHDFGEKTFLGRKGNFNGDDIVRILLEEERTAEFITEKIWKAFISEEPDADEVKRLAAAFRDSKYELKTLMRGILTSDYFRGQANRGNMIKSPVDLVVGACRTFEAHPAQAAQMSAYGKLLGQDLFQPPDVAGWKGGSFWIDANMLITRHKLARLVLAKPDPAFIKRYEGQLRQQKVAALKAEDERREIERLMNSQTSALDNLLGGDGDELSFGDDIAADFGGTTDTTSLDFAVDDALAGVVKPEELVRREMKNMKTMDLQQWAKEVGLADKPERLQQILLPIPPIHQSDTMEAYAMVSSLMLDPAYQLK
jgi:uncharacterized protein (DUF1800 family)